MNSYMPNHVIGTAFGLEQMASQLHGHNPWLVCEVALRASPHVVKKTHPRVGPYKSNPKSQVT